MVTIKTVDPKDLDMMAQACDLLHAAHEAERLKTGIVINTYGIDAQTLSVQLVEADGRCYIAEYDSIPVGTVSVLRPKVSKWYADKNSKELRYFAVHPQYQGEHIGTQLFQYVLMNEKYGSIILSTDERNVIAIHLYEKIGFKIVEYSRGRKSSSNAVKMALWREKCPIDQRLLSILLLKSKIKCMLIKYIL